MPDEELYREHILDHYKNPRNKGALADYSFKNKQNNPLCGDVIELFVKCSPDGVVQAVTFEGSGCAISQASASLLTEHIKGKTLDELKALSAPDVLELLGVPINEARMKCATLTLKALEHGIKTYAQH